MDHLHRGDSAQVWVLQIVNGLLLERRRLLHCYNGFAGNSRGVPNLLLRIWQVMLLVGGAKVPLQPINPQAVLLSRVVVSPPQILFYIFVSILSFELFLLQRIYFNFRVYALALSANTLSANAFTEYGRVVMVWVLG